MSFYSKKILVVESHSKNAETLRALLSDAGYETVITVATVNECLDTIEKEKINLLLVGNIGSDDERLSMLTQLNVKQAKNKPAVLCLIKNNVEISAIQVIDAGAQDFLIKPFAVKELLLRVNVLLSHGDNEEDEAYMAFEQNKMAAVGEMISMIAHQWRQPLSSMGATIARIEIDLLMDSFSKDELTKSCADMKSTIGYLSDTIDDFRYFFTPSKEKEQTTLEEIVSRTESVISISLAHNRITLIVDEPLVDVTLSLYVSEVVQVLINLLNNATDELISRKIVQPCIWISSAKIGNYVTISVRDNAGGIKDDIIDKVFDPYFSTKKKKNGSGLGLYMARNIIQRHCHGAISVRNGEEGAEFMLKIPIVDEEE